MGEIEFKPDRHLFPGWGAVFYTGDHVKAVNRFPPPLEYWGLALYSAATGAALLIGGIELVKYAKDLF